MAHHRSVKYLLNYRLLWGQPDTIAILRSSLDAAPVASDVPPKPHAGELPPLPPNAPTHFVAGTPPELYFIAMNDWPYSGVYCLVHFAFIHSFTYIQR